MENKKYKTTFTAAKVSRRSDEGYHKQYIQEKESQSDQAACLWIFRKKGQIFLSYGAAGQRVFDGGGNYRERSGESDRN